MSPADGRPGPVGKDRVAGDNVMQLVVMVKDAVDDKIQLPGTGHGVNLIVEFVAGESTQGGTAAKAMAQMVCKNRMKVGNAWKEYLAATAETIQGVGKDRADADAEIGGMGKAVDLDFGTAGQIADGYEVGGMAVMVEKLIFGSYLRPEGAVQFLAGQRPMSAEGDDYRDVVGRDADLSEFAENDLQDRVFRRGSSQVLDEDADGIFGFQPSAKNSGSQGRLQGLDGAGPRASTGAFASGKSAKVRSCQDGGKENGTKPINDRM